MKLNIVVAAFTICSALYARENAAFALHVRQLENALNYLGQPLSAAEQKVINDAIGETNEAKAIGQLQQVLDKHVLCFVDINRESRVKVEVGPAKPELVEGGSRLFPVKVNNDAHITAQLAVDSPNSGNVYVQPEFFPPR